MVENFRIRKCYACKKKLEDFEGNPLYIHLPATASFPMPSGGAELYCEKCYKDAVGETFMEDAKEQGSKTKNVLTNNVIKVQPNKGNIDIIVEVVRKEKPRTFEKFGKIGRVCDVKIKDNSGMIKLTLWNEDIDKIKEGDKIHLENGWCSEYNEEKQLSVGKFGKITVVESTLDVNDRPLPNS